MTWGPLSRAHAGTFLSVVRGPRGGLCLALVPAILLLGFLSRGNKHVDQALFRTAENWQQPKCPGTDVMKEILGSFSRGYVVQLLKGRWEGTRCGRENDGEILLGEK